MKGAAPDARTLLRLTQWLSPAFPVSAYAYSHGLEAEIALGRVDDGPTVQAWIEGVLRAGAGRTDVALMVAAMAQEADLERWGIWRGLWRGRLSAGRRHEIRARPWRRLWPGWGRATVWLGPILWFLAGRRGTWG